MRVLDESGKGDGRRCVQLHRAGDREYVLKRYGRRRGRFRSAVRVLGSILLAGKSAPTAHTCRRVEAELKTLWAREGFDVPGPPPPGVEEFQDGPALAMEYVPGPTLFDLLRSDDAGEPEKLRLLGRAGEVTGRRHARALELSEPRLLFERPSLDHLFVSGDRLVHFDLEIAFVRTRDLPRLVRKELAGLLTSIYRSGRETFEGRLRTFLERYGDPERISRVAGELAAFGGVPPVGAARPILRLLRGSRRRRRGREIGETLGRLFSRRSPGSP